MAKLPVALQKIFAGALPPAGNIAQPGSTAGGTPVFSSDPAILQQLAAWANGYAAQLINAPSGLSSPVLEELNAILYVLTYQIAYLKQSGIPEWDPSVTYYTNGWALVAGVPYISKTDANINNNPATDSTNWKTYTSTLSGASDGQLKAWIVFDGRDGTINESFNIQFCTRVSSGVYLFTFTNAFVRYDSYGWSGAPGTRPGQVFLSGDDNFLVGGVRGQFVNRSAAQCEVYCWDRVLNANEDSSLIAVQFFGR